MMSQQRTRKLVGAEPAPRGRPCAKGSGDTPSYVQNKQQRHRSRSKTKIPKNLRYDLENALVGLCDVWFEEIKPHLVRNNIKVHVEGLGRGPASGDHSCLPPGAAGCSHLDPGAAPDLRRRVRASYAGFCSTQPTASRARSRRPPAPASPPVSLAPASSLARPQDSLTKNQSIEVKQPAKRRKHHGARRLSCQYERVPRLCRTYSVIPPPSPRNQSTPRRIQTAVETYTGSVKQHKPLKFYTPRRRNPKMLEKSTQTLPLTGMRCSSTTTVHTLKQNSITTTKLPCSRRLGTTTIVSKQQNRRKDPLFKADLIEIIAEQSEKQLRCLFKSPREGDSCSTFNLVQIYKSNHNMLCGKKTPWR